MLLHSVFTRSRIAIRLKLSLRTMKCHVIAAIGCLIAFAGSPSAHGQTLLLSDDFSGSSLNATNWIPSTPLPGASVSVSNGLILTDNGEVLTQSGFPTQIEIDLIFQFTGTLYDSFKIDTRTNGALFLTSGQFAQGIRASFRMMSDTGSTANNVELDDVQEGSQEVQLGLATYPMSQGQTYFVRIIETATNVSLYVNDFTNPLISAATTSSYGSQIGLSNREGAAAGSGISDGSQVTIKAFSVSIPSTPAPTPAPDRLINVSTRGFVGTGSEVLIGGFVVTGTTTEKVLIRGDGPTLAQFGVAGSLAAPQLTLVDSTGKTIATNTVWGNPSVLSASTVQASIQTATAANFATAGAFALPAGSADSAMVAVLPPGSYTAEVTGVGNTTGVALVEVYELP